MLNGRQPRSHALKLLVSPPSVRRQSPCAFTMPRYFPMGGVTTSMKPINEREHERVCPPEGTKTYVLTRTCIVRERMNELIHNDQS